MFKDSVKGNLKKILPRSLINWLQAVRTRIDIQVAIVAARAPWRSALYYSLYSGEFRREMHSVLQARSRYYESQSGQSPNSFLLRRNIHRLEKGLIMRPRRDIFGEGYINETIHYLEVCLNASCLSETEVSWTQSVLADYFTSVQSSHVIERARVAYDAISELLASGDTVDKGPFAHSSLAPATVSLEDFKALCVSRHSVRWFEPRTVPRGLIDVAIDIAATAPSACNRQPFKFYVFDDPARAQEIGAIPMGTAGFSHNFQSVIVVVGDLSAYPFEKDRHIIYIDSGLAVMQLQLALETQGLGSCAINWPDIERHERRMARELDLEPYQRPVMLLAVGYPQKDALVPYSAKKTAADLIERPK